jgi:protein involved in polysaccharide export with SLBB domain
MRPIPILRRGTTALLVLGVLVLAGCKTPSERKSSDRPRFPDHAEPDLPVPIRAGDYLFVGCFAWAPSPGWVLGINDYVRPDGTLTLMSNNVFTAAGKTCDELEKEVRDYYVARFYNSMEVRIYQKPMTVKVCGEVRSPGYPRFPGQMTVLEAIELSGGFTKFANPKKVQIRDLVGGRQFIVNCTKARADQSANVQVSPGYVITVPRSFWWWLKK